MKMFKQKCKYFGNTVERFPKFCHHRVVWNLILFGYSNALGLMMEK